MLVDDIEWWVFDFYDVVLLCVLVVGDMCGFFVDDWLVVWVNGVLYLFVIFGFYVGVVVGFGVGLVSLFYWLWFVLVLCWFCL